MGNSKEKQIDEMVKAVCENYGSCSKCSILNGEYDKTCSIYKDCKALYNAGYRKASEVAREIFADVTNAWAEAWTESEFLEMLKELKKKYTEGENDG